MGWSLSAGGVVSRNVKGSPDEQVSGVPNVEQCYYYNYVDLSPGNWNSTEHMQNIYDERYIPDLEPDEFTFNFNGYSGSFYMDHTGQWKVSSKESVPLQVIVDPPGAFELEALAPVDGSNFKGIDIILPRIFQRINIITEDGTTYVFGGTSNSIEFSRTRNNNGDKRNNFITANSWFLTKIVSPGGTREIVLDYTRGAYVVRQSSYLSASEVSEDGNYSHSVPVDCDKKSLNLINPVYLNEIRTSNCVVQFSISASNELDYDFYGREAGVFDMYEDLDPADGHFFDVHSSWMKLNNVSFYDVRNMEKYKEFVFTYNNDPAKRLFLNSLKEIGKNGEIKPPHVFTYNNSKELPEYNSRKLDHWGFYNGRDFFENVFCPTRIEGADFIAYYNSREPVAEYLYSGVLERIIYPTGGFTELIFEPHTYSVVARNPVEGIEHLSEVKIGGGLRIKRIISNDGKSPALLTKEYLYEQDNPNLSSGVLGGYPQYKEEFQGSLDGGGSINILYFGSNSVEPLSYSAGSHISYSRVEERSLGSGYTIFTYSNHDEEKYLDKPWLYGYIVGQYHFTFGPFCSMSHERGHLLSKETYNEQGVIQHKIENVYNENPNRFNEHIRAIYQMYRTHGPENKLEPRLISYLIYRYPMQLKQSIGTTYNSGSPSNFVEVTTDYTYSPDHLQLQTITQTQSDGSNRITKYFYPPDYLSTSGHPMLNTMKSQHIYSPIVEQIIEEEKDGITKVIGGEYNFYRQEYGIVVPDKTLKTELLSPAIITESVNNNGTPDYSYYEPFIKYDDYDEKGNLIEYHLEDNVDVTYLWGYNLNLPVAKAVNSNSSEIYFNSFEETSEPLSTSTERGLDTDSHTGEYSYKMWEKSQYYGFCPGKTLKLNRNDHEGKYKLSGWIKTSTNYTGGHVHLLVTILNMNGSYAIYNGANAWLPIRLQSTQDKWEYAEIEFDFDKIKSENTGTEFQVMLSVWNTSATSWSKVDDLRFHPSDAQMFSYTYDPLVGQTSTSNANSTPTHYQYDEFGRLQYIKDQDENVVNEYSYEYSNYSVYCGDLSFNKEIVWQGESLSTMFSIDNYGTETIPVNGTATLERPDQSTDTKPYSVSVPAGSSNVAQVNFYGLQQLGEYKVVYTIEDKNCSTEKVIEVKPKIPEFVCTNLEVRCRPSKRIDVFVDIRNNGYQGNCEIDCQYTIRDSNGDPLEGGTIENQSIYLGYNESGTIRITLPYEVPDDGSSFSCDVDMSGDINISGSCDQ